LHVVSEKIHGTTRGRERKPGTQEQKAEVLTTYRNVHNESACHRPTVRNFGLRNDFQFELINIFVKENRPV